jgi:arylsulfatase
LRLHTGVEHRVFRRADENSNTYWDFVISHTYICFAMQALVAQQMGAFKAFPPRQKAASFNLDAVMRSMEDAGGGANH